MIRSSRSGEIYRKGTLKNFAKFIGKDLRQSLFFKLQNEAYIFIKKETLAQMPAFLWILLNSY